MTATLLRLSFLLVVSGLLARQAGVAFVVAAEVWINEVMPTDAMLLADEDGDYPGWMELHNPGAIAVNLAGYGLSDDPSRPFKWVCPDVILPPGGYLIVFASGKDRRELGPPPGSWPDPVTPDRVAGLRLWLDAADGNTVVLSDGKVAEWQDKSGRAVFATTPTELTPDRVAGLTLWLDAADTNTVTLAGEGVAAWADKSGAGNQASQGEAGQRPRLVRQAIGAKPVVRFDGANDYLGFSELRQIRSVFWIGREDPEAPDSERPLLGHLSSCTFQRGQLRRIYRESAYAVSGGGRTWVNGQMVAPSLTRVPQTLALVTTVSPVDLQANLLSGDRLLGQRWWWGDVAELLIFNRSVTEVERVSLELYLSRKWGIARVSVPVGYDAVQSERALRPTYLVNPLTGLPHLCFDGLDDVLAFPRIDQIRSLFCVVREDHGRPRGYRPLLGDPASYDFHRGEDRLLYSRLNARRAVWGSTRFNGQPTNALVARLPKQWVLVSTETTSDCGASTLSSDRNMPGRSWAGDFAEVVLFDRLLSNAERAGMESYLMQKWRLPLRALHSNFGLGAKGEPVVLTAPSGALVDQIVLPPLRSDLSLGRLPGDGSLRFYDQPTPGTANLSTGWPAATPDPVLLPPGGLYQGSVTVTLQTNGLAADWYYTLDGAEPTEPLAEAVEVVWMDDALPQNASVDTAGGDNWQWVTEPRPASGTLCHRSKLISGFHQHAFLNASNPLPVGASDILFTSVNLDSEHPPREIMLQFCSDNWEHRAYWGEDRIKLGTRGTVSRFHAGTLPVAGRWVRLEVPAAALGLERNLLTGLSFVLYDGRAWWDCSGKVTRQPSAARLYGGPIVLTRSAVVRARAYGADRVPSRTTTQSYVINFPTTIPVLSLATEPRYLWSEQEGLLVQGPNAAPGLPFYGANFWQNWEWPVHLEFFEPTGTNGFHQQVGLQVHGAWSRSAPQKSLELKARARYGSGRIHYQVFPDLGVDEFGSLLLRNAGNDWGETFFRDAFVQELMNNTGLDISAYRPVNVMLNGQYYGVLNLREKTDDEYIEVHHGVPADALDMMADERAVQAGDSTDYDALMAFVKSHDLSLPEQYSLLTNRLDVANFIDYQIIEIFSDNDDWPGWNVLGWRQRSPASPWRWILKDLDGGFSLHHSPGNGTRNTLLAATAFPGYGADPDRSTLLLRTLVTNRVFRNQFISRFADHLNSRFEPATVIARVDAMQAALEPEVQRHIDRWRKVQVDNWTRFASLAEWRGKVEDLRTFATVRPAYVRQHLVDFFGLSGTDRVRLDVVNAEGGEVLINDLTLAREQLPWSGIYFRDVPVTVSALPSAGYRFVGWEGTTNSTNTVLVFNIQDDVVLKARFELEDDLDPGSLRPSPFDLRSHDYVLSAFPANTPALTYPLNMLFLQTCVKDPGLGIEMESEWTLPYDRQSRSRICGLGDWGFSFINTSDPQPEPGAGYVGAALISLRTIGVADVEVAWTGGTVTPNARIYAVRLQYRVGTRAPFIDVLDDAGDVVEYRRSDIAGDFQVIGPVRLPPDANNRPVVQLRWKYYFIPTGATGPRAELRVDDILVGACTGRDPLELLSLVRLPNPGFRARFSARAGESVELLESDDLNAWKTLRIVRADGSGTVQFEVSISMGSRHKFYKLRRLP